MLVVCRFSCSLLMENPGSRSVADLSLPVTSSRSSVPDSHSSTGHSLPLGDEPCCPAVREVRREVSELVSHFAAEKEVLQGRICRLEQIRAGLQQEIRRLSDLSMLLHQNVEFWKLGCLQGDMWRERYAVLESSLIPGSSGPVPLSDGVDEVGVGARLA